MSVAETESNDDGDGGRVYEGIRRLPYFLVLLGLNVVQFFFVAEMVSQKAGAASFFAVIAAFLGLSMVPVSMRLKNIGMDPWWCLLLLVPLVNLFVGVRCLVAPEWYEDSKELDRAGKVLVGLLVVPLAVMLVFMCCL